MAIGDLQMGRTTPSEDIEAGHAVTKGIALTVDFDQKRAA